MRHMPGYDDWKAAPVLVAASTSLASIVNILPFREISNAAPSSTTQRNDQSLNRYNRVMVIGWLANTDTAPCTSFQAAMNYLAKFCTKPKTKSTS